MQLQVTDVRPVSLRCISIPKACNGCAVCEFWEDCDNSKVHNPRAGEQAVIARSPDRGKTTGHLRRACRVSIRRKNCRIPRCRLHRVVNRLRAREVLRTRRLLDGNIDVKTRPHGLTWGVVGQRWPVRR